MEPKDIEPLISSIDSSTICFVTGYDTLSNQTYRRLAEYLPKADFFYYDSRQIFCQIVRCFIDYYHQGSCTTILCHSTGVSIVTSAFSSFKRQPRQIICLMPYLSIHSPKMLLLNHLPTSLCDLLWLPNWFTVPTSVLKSIYNINDFLHDFKIRWLGHIKDLTNHVDDRLFHKFCQICRQVPVTVIYGKQETLVPLSLNELDRLKDLCHLIPFDSRHEPFNDRDEIREQFKKLLLFLL